MQKLVTLLVSSFLLVGTFGCQESANNTTKTPSPTNGTAEIATKQSNQATPITDKTVKSAEKSPTNPENKAKTDTHKKPAIASDDDLEKAVSQQLQKGLPGNKLEVENEQGEIILKGKAASQEELQKAEKLVKEVKGVKKVKLEAKVEAEKKS